MIYRSQKYRWMAYAIRRCLRMLYRSNGPNGDPLPNAQRLWENVVIQALSIWTPQELCKIDGWVALRAVIGLSDARVGSLYSLMIWDSAENITIVKALNVACTLFTPREIDRVLLNRLGNRDFWLSPHVQSTLFQAMVIAVTNEAS